MVVRRIGAHATHYVSADGRRLVASPLALQLIDDVLRSKGLAARTSPDSWKDGEDLITSSHRHSVHRAGPASIVRMGRVVLAALVAVTMTTSVSAVQSSGFLQVRSYDGGRSC
jgi:hypothetical protein